MRYCQNCGKEISEEKFCPYCGAEIKHVSVEGEANAIEQEDRSFQASAPTEENVSLTEKKRSKTIIYIIGAAVATTVILIVLCVCLLNSGPDFKTIYKDHCDPVWAEVANDGSYLYIDTNPENEEDKGLAYISAYSAIEEINIELGLPESLFVDMGNTTGNDGKQTEEFDNMIVSWKYHPDLGLEVTYKSK